MLVEGGIIPVNRPAMVVGNLGTAALTITQALRLLGFQQVDEAPTVENAIERLEPVRYGLILCDVGREHLEGFALLTHAFGPIPSQHPSPSFLSQGRGALLSLNVREQLEQQGTS
jgi:CheY-like chemotaxis protein